MNVALVYDRVNKWGGAERVLLALHEIWPEAPLYTAIYDPAAAPWAGVFDVRTSFLQRIPFAQSYHELLPVLTPMAFESFSFDDFDVVISVTSAEAKSIITKPHTLHICYCLTPTRYLWSGYETYLKNPGLGKFGKLGVSVLRWLAPTLRRWDKIAAHRPDYYLAISDHASDRIRRYYGRKVEKVIYPPVEVLKGSTLPKQDGTLRKYGDYFLVVSRLVGYKRIDLLIDAFNELGWPLVVIGDGRDGAKLKKQARNNVTFVTRHLTEEELAAYYGDCRAFVFAADEDFGIAAAEAQACGKPVIAYRESGIGEIVRDNETGVLFDKQNKEALVFALRVFQKKNFSPDTCKKNAMRFGKERFKKEMKEEVEKLYRNHIKP